MIAEWINNAWQPQSNAPAWQWVEENVELGNESELRGKVSFRHMPMQKFVLDRFQDRKVRRITQLVSAQSGKTKGAEFCLMWSAKHDPIDTIWYTDTRESAQEFFKTRLLPDLENCHAISNMVPQARDKRSQRLLQLDSMNLYVFGAEAKRNRERITAGRVFCDEVRNYPQGALQSIRNRYKTIREYKEILFSVAGDAIFDDDGEPIGDELYLSYWGGTRHMGYWPCPDCGRWQPFRFGRDPNPIHREPREAGGLIWDREAGRPEKGVINLKAVMPTVRYECENVTCKAQFENSQKMSLIRNLEVRQTNPMALPEHVSVHWNELYMPFEECDWARIVAKFLIASMAARRGNFESLKVVVQETFGEPFVQRKGEPLKASIVRERCGEYKVGDSWPGDVKAARIITVDVQEAHLKFVNRHWKPGGESRLIEAGSLASFDDLRAYQLAHDVRDACVWIDSAYETRKTQKACSRFGRWVKGATGNVWIGWAPMLGHDAKEFSLPIGSGKTIKTFWKRAVVDPGMGQSDQGARLVPRYSWSNPHYKELLYDTIIPGQGVPWWLPKNIGDEYVSEVLGIEKQVEVDTDGAIHIKWVDVRRHDFADCELMQLVAADIFNITRA